MPLLKPPRGSIIIPGHPRARGLGGYWVFNENSGNTAYDLSGHNTVGTFVGDISWQPEGILCPGTDAYVQCANHAHIDALTQWTVVAKVKMANRTYQPLLTWGGGGTSVAPVLWLRYSGTQPLLYQASGIYRFFDAAATTLLQDGNKHIVAFVYIGNVATSSMYVDGKAYSAGSTGGTTGSDTRNLVNIGGPAYYYELDGQVDWLGIWNYGLPASKIISLSRDPFQMFERPSIAFLAGVSVGGDVSVTPAAVSAVAATVSPAVVLGSLSVTPNPADAVGTTVNPTVVAGSISISPSSGSCVAASVDPIVISGSVAISPSPASSVAASVSPAVVQSSVSISPTPSTAVGATVDPTVLAGNVSVSPTPASTVAVSVDPTVVCGSISVTPASASSVASGVDPTVQVGGLVISPAAASAVASGVDPTVVLGSVAVSPAPASAIAATVNPTVVHGSISLSPTPAASVAASVDPVVVQGSLSISVSPASAVAVSIDPTVMLGSTSVTPSAASAVAAGVDPTVLAGDLASAYFYLQLLRRRC